MVLHHLSRRMLHKSDDLARCDVIELFKDQANCIYVCYMQYNFKSLLVQMFITCSSVNVFNHFNVNDVIDLIRLLSVLSIIRHRLGLF